jgi:hypothetical protein
MDDIPVKKERCTVSKLGLLSLICALTAGVFGFGVNAPDGWTWNKASFFFFLLPALTAFVESTMQRPSLLWEVVDEVRHKRDHKQP